MPLNLFPARAPIGRATDSTGRQIDVLMTVEFARALSDLLQRVGGSDGMSSEQIIAYIEEVALANAMDAESQTAALACSVFDLKSQDPLPATESAQIAALRAEVESLRAQIDNTSSLAVLASQIEDLRREIGFITPAPRISKYTATGSRAGNVALASLLTALAGSGLIVDSTVP